MFFKVRLGCTVSDANSLKSYTSYLFIYLFVVYLLCSADDRVQGLLQTITSAKLCLELSQSQLLVEFLGRKKCCLEQIKLS